MRELTKNCEKITKNKIKFSKQPKTSIYDIPYFITDNSKIQRIYKWKPKRSMKQIIKDTYNWLIANKKQLKKYL